MKNQLTKNKHIKKNIITGVAIFSFLALMAGGLLVTQADAATALANKTNSVNTTLRSWFHNRTPLSESQKSELEKERASRQVDRDARQTAVETAVKNNNYQAWVQAVGSNNPIIKKITATNFSEFIKAYNLRQQSKQIMTSLGLGSGTMFSNHHGFMMGIGMDCDMDMDSNMGSGMGFGHEGHRGQHQGWGYAIGM